jgi:hypothetical protein
MNATQPLLLTLKNTVLPPTNKHENSSALPDPALGHQGNVEDEGHFSSYLNAAADSSSSQLALQLTAPEQHISRASLSLVMLVERIFRAFGLSPAGSRKKRALFWFWILWFFARSIFLIVSIAKSGSDIDPNKYLCQVRPTAVSPRGYPNRDAGSIIALVDFFGWILIYFSSFGGRSVSIARFSPP